MTESLDIFSIDGKDCLWIGCAASTEDAVHIIRTNSPKSSDAFVVLSQITGQRCFYRIGSDNEVVQVDAATALADSGHEL